MQSKPSSIGRPFQSCDFRGRPFKGQNEWAEVEAPALVSLWVLDLTVVAKAALMMRKAVLGALRCALCYVDLDCKA